MNVKRLLVLTVAMAVVLSALAFPPAASARVFIRAGIPVFGPPPPLRHEVVVVRPGPGYVWVPGYWDWRPVRHRYVWVSGVWRRPPHVHAVWVGPHVGYRHHHRYYYRGYWR
jgi:hypothetical protein